MFTPYSYDDSEIMLHHSLNEVPLDADFPMHAHHHCELYLFISGNGYFAVEGNIYPLNYGTVLLMRTGETHKLHIQPNQPYERVAIHFPADLLTDAALPHLYNRCMHRPLGQNNQITLSSTQLQWILGCLDRIYSVKLDEHGHADKVRTYLKNILLELEYCVSQTGLSEDTDALPAEDDNTVLVERLVTYINAHLIEIHSMDDLEEKFFFSQSYLNRIFRKTIGSSIWDYIILKRLLLARNLLAEGKTVTAAYSSSGFSDYSSFFKQYKNRFGKTPIQDRIKKGNTKKD